MPQRTPSCQLANLPTGDSRQKSPSQSGTGCLRYAPQCQWLTATTGRIATDGHSWMTAYHWAADPKHKRYAPTRSHGPKTMNETTHAVAKEIAALTECRPGIAYLMRKLGASERTVEYHLDMLREAGLLVYRSIGTRIGGGVRQASVYERVIPIEFDAALGIRTIQRDDTAPAYTRVPVGAAPEHRKELGKLAKKATRKPRRRARKNTGSRKPRCTLMQGGTSTVSSTGISSVPSEAKRASGDTIHLPQQRTTSTTRAKAGKTLNRVGRCYQLARQCQTLMPWLGHGSLPRLAWVLQHVADAGWTALEVQAIAEDAGPVAADDVRRPSGLLASRLKGAHLLYDTAAKRQTAVQAWQDSPVQQRVRHEGYERGITGTPQRMSVQRIMTEAMTRARAALHDTTSVDIAADDDGLALEDLTREQVIEMRRDAAADPQLIHTTIDFAGEAYARRLYTNRLVDRALTRFTSNITLNSLV